ncbi:hypothetical protein BDF19DRAFT_329567 [Syncephalis fuscata]|nr:hypothetical protein BDF19DRAFT_329567 [Syncephalis fuscata]
MHLQLKADKNMKTNGSVPDSEADLALMLQTRHASRMMSLIANLEAKYAPKSLSTTKSKKKGLANTKKRDTTEDNMDMDEPQHSKRKIKKAAPSEPSEEEFMALQDKLFGKNSD